MIERTILKFKKLSGEIDSRVIHFEIKEKDPKVNISISMPVEVEKNSLFEMIESHRPIALKMLEDILRLAKREQQDIDCAT